MPEDDWGALAEIYDEAFFGEQSSGSARSAAVVVPVMLDLMPWVDSVVDLGCGTGGWIRRFQHLGVSRVLGIDAVRPPDALLEIDADLLLRADLRQPVALPERFDLCLTLEVVEHLSPESSRQFVTTACDLSDVVAFGAAVPGQGGRDHVNEQWPSHWSVAFAASGYVLVDAVRPVIWNDPRVEWWYAQNTLLFVRESREDLLEEIRARAATTVPPLDVVHPRCFEGLVDRVALAPAPDAGSARLEDEVARLREEVARVSAEIRSLRSSRSWRYTAPARAVGGYARRQAVSVRRKRVRT